MQRDPLLQLCYPCGFGKGYLIGTDLLKHLLYNDTARVFALASHRLGLNDQHVSDIFKLLIPLLGDVVFAFLGSSGGLDMVEMCRENDYLLTRQIDAYNTANPDRRITPNGLTITTTKPDKLVEFINRHHGKKVVIITTYHSMGILSSIEELHTLYCDEAHELASDFQEAHKQRSFKSNYEKIICPRKFFFSATPKDCSDDPANSFLMNNTAIFGKRIGMSHLEAVNKGYVVSIVIDFLQPLNFVDEHNQDYGSVENKARIIMEAYNVNRIFLNERSSNPDLIAPKILVRLSSVGKDLWPVYNALKQISGDIKIFASASEDSEKGNVYSNIISLNGENIEYDKDNDTFVPWAKSISRKSYIESLQSLKDTDSAIILHHDTISEGLNVPGFTAFIPFSDKLMTTTKLYQNLGRIIRLNKIDKDKLRKREIEVDGNNWIKPVAQMIIPYWSGISKSAAITMAKVIRELETNMGAKTGTEIPFGNDIATGYKNNDEGSNRKRSDNRNENLEGIAVFNFYDRYKIDDEVTNVNNSTRNYTAIERLNNI